MKSENAVQMIEDKEIKSWPGRTMKIRPDNLKRLGADKLNRGIAIQRGVNIALDEYFARRDGKEIPPSPFGRLAAHEEKLMHAFLLLIREASEEKWAGLFLKALAEWAKERDRE